jgi:hypothetical protein
MCGYSSAGTPETGCAARGVEVQTLHLDDANYGAREDDQLPYTVFVFDIVGLVAAVIEQDDYLAAIVRINHTRSIGDEDRIRLG